jgi:outer membrane protein
MKKTGILLGILLSGLLMAGTASAEMRVGYFNVTKVVKESPQYQKMESILEKEKDKRRRDLQAKADQIKKLEEKYTRDAAVMSESEVNRLRRDIESRSRKLKNELEEQDAQVRMIGKEELDKIYKLVSEVLREIVKQEGYDLILTPQSVAYFNPKLDISDKVLTALKNAR